jgi:hypothetical protein
MQDLEEVYGTSISKESNEKYYSNLKNEIEFIQTRLTIKLCTQQN